MRGEVDIVRNARRLLHPDGGRWSWKGEFVSLSVDLLTAAHKSEGLRIPSVLTSCIGQDVWNISSMAHRLEWMRHKSSSDSQLRSMWGFYASTDIEHFHVELRSIMDYAAEIIAGSADKRGQIPTTFRTLFEWVQKNPANENRVGHDLAKAVKSAEWFPDFRDLRDTLIHRGGHTLVFGDPNDGILFQVLKGFMKRVPSHEYIMYNENVAYFDRYAAVHVSHVFSFLEELSSVLRTRYHLNAVGQGAAATWPGLEILAYWMDGLISYLNGNASTIEPS